MLLSHKNSHRLYFKCKITKCFLTNLKDIFLNYNIFQLEKYMLQIFLFALFSKAYQILKFLIWTTNVYDYSQRCPVSNFSKFLKSITSQHTCMLF